MSKPRALILRTLAVCVWVVSASAADSSDVCKTNTAFFVPEAGDHVHWQGGCLTLAQCQALCTDECTGFNWWPASGGCRTYTAAYVEFFHEWQTISGSATCTHDGFTEPLCTECPDQASCREDGDMQVDNAGECCCPVYRRIESLSECQAAIDDLGLSRDNEYVETQSSFQGQIPGGCSHSTEDEEGLHWDTAEPGQARLGFQPICKLCESFTDSSTCTRASCVWRDSDSWCVECTSYTSADTCAAASPNCKWQSETEECKAEYWITQGTTKEKQRNPCEDVGLYRLGTQDSCDSAATALSLSDTKSGGFSHSNIAPFGCVWKLKPSGAYKLKWEEKCDNAVRKASEMYSSICKLSSGDDSGCPAVNLDDDERLFQNAAAVHLNKSPSSSSLLMALAMFVPVAAIVGFAVVRKWKRSDANDDHELLTVEGAEAVPEE